MKINKIFQAFAPLLYLLIYNTFSIRKLQHCLDFAGIVNTCALLINPPIELWQRRSSQANLSGTPPSAVASPEKESREHETWGKHTSIHNAHTKLQATTRTAADQTITPAPLLCRLPAVPLSFVP